MQLGKNKTGAFGGAAPVAGKASSGRRGLGRVSRKIGRDARSLKNLIRRQGRKGRGGKGTKSLIRRDFAKLDEQNKLARLAAAIRKMEPSQRDALIGTLRTGKPVDAARLASRDERAARDAKRREAAKKRRLARLRSAFRKTKRAEKSSERREDRSLKSAWRRMTSKDGMASRLGSLLKKIRRDGRKGTWGKRFAGLEGKINKGAAAGNKKKRETENAIKKGWNRFAKNRRDSRRFRNISK